MKKNQRFTVITEFENDMYVAFCPEIDVVSQGKTIDEAINNLKEAIELFFECASKNEITERYHEEVFVSHLEVAVG